VRSETCTWETPEPASEYVPQYPIVAQPASQPAVLYVPDAAGKVVAEAGAVLSTSRSSMIVELVTLAAASVITTRRS
jgi:hypothetical protein